VDSVYSHDNTWFFTRCRNLFFHSQWFFGAFSGILCFAFDFYCNSVHYCFYYAKKNAV